MKVTYVLGFRYSVAIPENYMRSFYASFIGANKKMCFKRK